jgi:glutamate 5-kinase
VSVAGRDALRHAKRVVVKVGTSSLSMSRGRLDPRRVARVAAEVAGAMRSGREVVLVSSGAIAAGLQPLGFTRRPSDLASLQACAAVGQSHLMDAYADAFSGSGIVCAQVLLTRQEIMHRQQYVNALSTFGRLLELGALPIVNENDTIATDEIRFGENDLLAALTANVVRADALVMLSDVDGLHAGGDRELIDEVEVITPDVERLAWGKGSAFSSGGMRSKIDAARIATASGVSAVIARMRSGVLRRVLQGRRVGTFFHPAASRLASRKAWIAFATMPKGRVVVDEGARDALVARSRSLLAAGVSGVEGSFKAGDAVEIAVGDAVFARGLVSFSADDLRRIAGRGSREASRILGTPAEKEVVHRDELVVL